MLKRLIIIWRNCSGSRTDQSTRVAARHEHAGWFFKEADLFENFLEDSSSYDFPEEFNPPDGKEVARVNTGVYQPFSLFLYPRFAPFSFHPIQIERGEEELLEPISFNVSLFPQGESIFSFPFFFFGENRFNNFVRSFDTRTLRKLDTFSLWDEELGIFAYLKTCVSFLANMEYLYAATFDRGWNVKF